MTRAAGVHPVGETPNCMGVLATEAETIPAAVLVEKVAVAEPVIADNNCASTRNNNVSTANHNRTAPDDDASATVSTGRTRCNEQHNSSDERCEILEHETPPFKNVI